MKKIKEYIKGACFVYATEGSKGLRKFLKGNHQNCKSDMPDITEGDVQVVRNIVNLSSLKNRIYEYSQSREKRNIVFFTAISRNYDSLKIPNCLLNNADYVLFTDEVKLNSGIWQVRYIPYWHKDPTRITRFVKTHAKHLFSDDYDVAIWVDSNIIINGDLTEEIDTFIKSGKPIAAFHHPVRKNIFEEAEACKKSSRDDQETIEEQMEHYRSIEYVNDGDLIESNVMFFNLHHIKLMDFLNTWWREIDQYSKRDQLSINYAIDTTSIEWHRIAKESICARNHPKFALVPHDYGKGVGQTLLDMLGDTYVRPEIFEKSNSNILINQISVDVIVCVYNAIDDVRKCIKSVLESKLGVDFRLIVVDDNSDCEMVDFLAKIKRNFNNVLVLRNDKNLGYTKSANLGLKSSDADFRILLNSDTIVAKGWVDKMVSTLCSVKEAGIVGAISNSASFQSAPDIRLTHNNTATNSIPSNVSLESINNFLETSMAKKSYAIVPIVHGFCFGVHKKVIEKIGFFDEQKFPFGYGEENDYCFRASDAGFLNLISLDTFVYHAKSKTFEEERRIVLMKSGNDAFEETYGIKRISRALQTLRENPLLITVRDRIKLFYKIKSII